MPFPSKRADIHTIVQIQANTAHDVPVAIALSPGLSHKVQHCLPTNNLMNYSLQAGSTGGVILLPSKACTWVRDRILSCVFMGPVRPQVGPISAWLSPLRKKIGRASCRERVCQYV